MIRQPVVAGQFYPGSASQLRTMIEKMVDTEAEKEDIIGLVSPHAGYIYSGPVAGAVISRVKFKDTFIILGPNHTGRGKPLSIMSQGKWRTPFGDVEIDAELARHLLSTTRRLQEDEAVHAFEHSIEVQLPFLQYFRPDVRIVPITLSFASLDAYKEIGKEIARAIRDTGQETVILASSDMTHYEPHDTASRKDRQAIDAILRLDEDELFRRVEEQNISMCGVAPVASLIAAARELGATSAELVKYQTSGDTSGDYSSVVGYAGIIIKAVAMHPLVQLAKNTIETYVSSGDVISPPDDLTPEMQQKAGVFVSLHKFGELRGCIGTFEPTRPNVAGEIISNAISSATRDPRFPPIAPEELGDLEYSVDVLTRPRSVKNKKELDPKKYGVIVECGFRKGLLLPDLDGVDTVDQQINICCQKAGILPTEPINLYKFEVNRYK
jgi:AmmeMemoRadiSam system protein B/AmmeMemoRadiSam system protein A